MKKFKKIAFFVLFLIIIILSFTIYTNASKNNENDIREKSLSEIKYVESKLINLFNSLNNIEFENYKISSQEINSQKNSDSSNSSSNSDSTARTISMHVLTQFYLTPYGEDGNFYEEFYERLEKSQLFTQSLGI